MLAILAAALGIVGKIFTAPATGAVSILASIAGGLGIRFYCGLAVGLVITNNHVRSDAFDLVKAIIGTII